MLDSSVIVDRANLWAKCEMESLFAVDNLPRKFRSHATCSEHTGMQSDCPIVLQIAKQEEDFTYEIKCRFPSA